MNGQLNGVNKDEHDGSLPSDSSKESGGAKDINLANGMNNPSSWAQRESFLTYFFGSGNKTDRTVLPDQPISGRNGGYSRDTEELEHKLENVSIIVTSIC